MKSIFNPERGIWPFFGWFGDIVLLSLLWVLCSIPLVTVGTSSTALYDAVIHGIRRKEGPVYQRFFHTFRQEWKTGCLSTLLWGTLAALDVLLYRALAVSGPNGTVTGSASIVFLLILFFLLCILSWVFPLLSRFTFRFAALNGTAVRLAFGNILRSAVMALLIVGGLALCSRNFFSAIFVPGLISWLSSHLIEPVFERYGEADSDSTT